MTPGVVLTLLGFGLGALLMTDRRSDPRAAATTMTTTALREQTIEAQEISARAAERARTLMARWKRTQ